MDKSSKIVSEYVVHTKYAKFKPEKNRRESWQELVQRNMQMHIKKYPALELEIINNYKYVFDRKVLPSMRSFQFAGRPMELSPARGYNCCAVAIDSPVAFSEIMFLLLSGCGVGYSVQKQHISQLPAIFKPTKTKRFLISDCIEGWADAVKVLIKAYMQPNKRLPIFDYSDIRKKGTLLKTSGGKAPGSDGLKYSLERVKIILDNKNDGEKLSSVEVHDIICIIADAVLSGGIRRSALISLFSETDTEMILCKSNFQVTNWAVIDSSMKGGAEVNLTVNEPYYGNTTRSMFIGADHLALLKEKSVIPWYYFQPQRGRANNSISISRSAFTKESFNKIWKIVRESGAGEPGFFLTNDLELLTNPCCFGGDSMLLTSDGYRPIKELAGVNDLKLVNKDGVVVPGKVWSNGVKKTIELEIVRGLNIPTMDNKQQEKYQHLNQTLWCTPEHELLTAYGEPIKAMDISRALIKNEENTAHTVYSTGNTRQEEVFDFSLDGDVHWGVVESVIAHNCEISLNSKQFCNLTTVNVSDVTTQGELNVRVKAAAFLGTLQAGYTDFHYLRNAWQMNTEKEALLGVSMTGIASGTVLNLDLTEAANVANTENARVSKSIGINKAARVTTIKPEGTGTLALGAIGSGVHAAHAPFYIRRIRINKTESVYKYLLSVCPSVLEDEHFSPNTMAVISIPQKCPDGYILRDESPLDLLDRVKRFHTEWVKPGHRSGKNTHNVSVTVSIKENEWDAVGEWLWENRSSYSGVSVLPYDGGTYIQAPFEECTEDKYNEMYEALKDIDLTQVVEYEDNTLLSEQAACAGGACEIV